MKKIYVGNIKYYFFEMIWVLCIVVLPIYLIAIIFNIEVITAAIYQKILLIIVAIGALLFARRILLAHLFIFLEDSKLCYKEGMLTGTIIGYYCIDLTDKDVSVTTFSYFSYFEGIKIHYKNRGLVINNLMFSKSDYKNLKNWCQNFS